MWQKIKMWESTPHTHFLILFFLFQFLCLFIYKIKNVWKYFPTPPVSYTIFPSFLFSSVEKSGETEKCVFATISFLPFPSFFERKCNREILEKTKTEMKQSFSAESNLNANVYLKQIFSFNFYLKFLWKNIKCNFWLNILIKFVTVKNILKLTVQTSTVICI